MSSLAKLILWRHLRAKLQKTLLTGDGRLADLLKFRCPSKRSQVRIGVDCRIRAIAFLDRSPQHLESGVAFARGGDSNSNQPVRLAVTIGDGGNGQRPF